MKKAIQFLILLTCIIYVNNFVYAYVNGYKTLKGASAVWSISPYLLLTVSSFILANDYKKEYSIVKKEARIGMALKILACIVAFFNYKFEIGSLEYAMRFVILAILFIINITLEYRMYKIAEGYVPKKSENEAVTEREKWSLKSYGKATTLGLSSFMLCALGGMNVVAIAQMNPYYSFICVCIFIVFLKMNYDKTMLFFENKSLGKRIFVRDAFYATVGFGYNLVIALELISLNEIFVNTALIVGVCFLYPTITTNRKISLRYKAVSKVVGSNLAYYFDDKKNPYKQM
ncbi:MULTISPECIES: hypothetical protein [Bacillus cereus group]|uniref:hypothetical protein n=1 Tax=Bacillus cereus group TaxID=86661 RepID=UPI000BFA359A|nr:MULTISPECIES: hypothetical protein [Bacillus cereus group]PFR32599.1 hypothetical protein COK19_01370 [Bacillus cereus]